MTEEPRLNSNLQMSRRIRRTPFTSCIEKLGVSGFTVVNHTLLPKSFKNSVVEDFYHLRTAVQIWDVGCQRQVEIEGPDALSLVQKMTPRNIANAEVGQCMYLALTTDKGKIINDLSLKPICKDLEIKLKKAVEREDYEKAAKLRDKIKELES